MKLVRGIVDGSTPEFIGMTPWLRQFFGYSLCDSLIGKSVWVMPSDPNAVSGITVADRLGGPITTYLFHDCPKAFPLLLIADEYGREADFRFEIARDKKAFFNFRIFPTGADVPPP